jgi:nucleoside phosphorylase
MELKGIGNRLENPGPHPALKDVRTGTWAGLTLHLVRTGVGRNAGRVARTTLDRIEADAVFCIGTAGGLSPRLKIGDVVVSTEILGPGPETVPLAADPILVEAAGGAGAVKGSCLTVEKALFTPEQKASALEETGAIVCEMEAAFVAEAAGRAGIPFLALKGISDTAKDSLPDVSRFMDDAGTIDRKRLAGYLAMHPAEAARSTRFLRNAGKAVEALTAVFLAILRSR